MGVLFLAACCWWQAVVLGRLRGLCISPNKVRIGGLKLESAGQILLQVVDFFIAVVLPWWKPKMATAKSTTASSNKVFVRRLSHCESLSPLPPLARGGSLEFDGRLFSLLWGLDAHGVGELISMVSEVLFFSSTCSGCYERRRKTVVFVREVNLPWSRDTKICGTHSVGFDCRPTLMAIWWPLSANMISDASSTSMRRPCSELAVALIVNLEPSGDVPGTELDGRGRSSLFHSCGGRPDCLFLFLTRVFFVIVRDFSGFYALSDVPNVICTRRFEN
jgi:hypothetical protein